MSGGRTGLRTGAATRRRCVWFGGFVWGAEFELCLTCRHILHAAVPTAVGHTVTPPLSKCIIVPPVSFITSSRGYTSVLLIGLQQIMNSPHVILDYAHHSLAIFALELQQQTFYEYFHSPTSTPQFWPLPGWAAARPC